jgi:hypothetical protein
MNYDKRETMNYDREGYVHLTMLSNIGLYTKDFH